MMEKEVRPPRLPRRILKLFLTSEEKSTILTDLDEYFHEIAKGKSRFISRCWYWRQILGSILSFAKRSVSWEGVMLKNYIKVALRNMKRQKGYSLINILGLAIGLTCCLLILLYVQYERSYDRYHENADHIYRVVEELDFSGVKRHMAITPAPFAPAMKNEFPEVKDAVRFMKGNFSEGKVLVAHGRENYYEDKWFFADQSVFEIFTFPLIKGDAKSALKEPFTVVISEEKARKYFGDEDPIGKVLTLSDRYSQSDFTVKGVLKNTPKNSHFRFDFLASFATIENLFPEWVQNWFNHMYYSYMLLDENSSPEALERKFPGLILKHAGKEAQTALKPHLQPLTAIHLHSHLESEIEANSDAVYVYIFATVALFILMIACINFMNLATARSAYRTREVGMRKVVGARRSQLVRQFLGESVLFSFIALPLAVIMMELLLPAFRAFTDRDLGFNYLNNWPVIFVLIGITLVVGCVSGIYPALFLSAFKPVKVLKGKSCSGSRGTVLRKGLIVFQFAVSIILIIATGIILSQVRYIRTTKLGFNKDQVIVLNIKDKELRTKYEVIKAELSKNPSVLNVTASSGIPGRISHHWFFRTEGLQEKKEKPSMWVMMVDHDFIKTLGMEIVEGRDFSRSFTTDEKEAIILNESAVKKYGWGSPLGRNIKTENKDGYVIGVVKDFHFKSFYQQIEPVMIYISPGYFEFISVRVAADKIPEAMAFIKKEWKELAPNRPLDYLFLNDDFDKVYRQEERAGKIFGYFSILAIFVACLGLFGLAAFTAEQRTKEIGIRKVLGATTLNIVTLLNKDFIKWVLVANLIAWPAAYYAMSRWLQSFAYRISIGWWMFLLAAVFVLVVAICTVGFQAAKAALANPSESLRYE
jgi:putative ABC transport system permease protein